jgi:hypothetical protein
LDSKKVQRKIASLLLFFAPISLPLGRTRQGVLYFCKERRITGVAFLSWKDRTMCGRGDQLGIKTSKSGLLPDVIQNEARISSICTIGSNRWSGQDGDKTRTNECKQQ